MKAKLIVLFFIFIYVFVSRVYCDNSSQARSLFFQANTQYSKERFEEAIASYEKALSLGFESGPLYYNLGNAYFKHGSLGKAILNYLRAKQLMPQDADLKSNLDYAQSLIKGGGVYARRKWFEHIVFAASGFFNLDKITMVSTVLYFILALVVILAITQRKLRKSFSYASLILSVLFVISLFLFGTKFYRTVTQKEAVIISRSSDSKFEPFIGATTFFTLNEGENVIVVSSKEDWIKVRRIDGKQGWIKKVDMAFL